MPDAHHANHVIGWLRLQHPTAMAVHRLDVDTSGVLLFALNEDAHRALSQAFEHRRVIKTYHCIVQGAPDWTTQTVRAALRANGDRQHRTIVDRANGKAACTTFAVMTRFKAHALLSAMPEHGRTHQIRVHAAVLAHPLAGDPLYGRARSAGAPVIARTALHAARLVFADPSSGRDITLESAHPQDFAIALKRA